MAEAIDENSIERLGRALLAQLSPITGTRSTGGIDVTSIAAAPVAVPANSYLLPVVRGDLRDDLLFKTVGDWQINPGATSSIPVTSNTGGARMNLPDDTELRFDPPLEGIAPTATVLAATTGGTDTRALVKRVGLFEDIDAQNPSEDMFAAKLIEYPALMLSWQTSEPAEGVMAGLRQGNNRGRRTVKFYREYFVAYIAAGRLASDMRRRQEGLVIAQAASRLWSDHLQNSDGEQLSQVGGGVDIIGRSRVKRGARHYIYAVRLRANQVLEQTPDPRVFHPWLTTRFAGSLEPPEPLPVVDIEDPMP